MGRQPTLELPRRRLAAWEADHDPTILSPSGRVMFSGVASAGSASVSVYPDSDKIGVRPPGGGPDRLDFCRGDAVDYWAGE